MLLLHRLDTRRHTRLSPNKLELFNELLNLPRIRFVFQAIDTPANNPVQTSCLLRVVNARAEPPTLLKFVFFLKGGLVPVQLLLGTYCREIVTVHGYNNVLLSMVKNARAGNTLCKTNADQEAGILALPALRGFLRAVHVPHQ